MKVPRLVVESELQLPAYTTASATATPDLSHVCGLRHSHARPEPRLWPTPQPQPCRILTPRREARDRNPHPPGHESDLLLLSQDGNSCPRLSSGAAVRLSSGLQTSLCSGLGAPASKLPAVVAGRVLRLLDCKTRGPWFSLPPSQDLVAWFSSEGRLSLRSTSK